MKLLENTLAKAARCHACGSKISFEQDLDQCQSIGAQLKLYYGSIGRTSVNSNCKEKQGLFYSGITQRQYYSFDLAIRFRDSTLFTIFSFRLFHIKHLYGYITSNFSSESKL